MSQSARGWNLSESEWKRVFERAQNGDDILEDGAYLHAAAAPIGGMEIQFYASSINKPPAWHFPFVDAMPEPDASSQNRTAANRGVAYVGRAYHDSATGFVEFEVEISAAADALLADYAGGVGDYDDVTIEQAIDRAVRGTPADMEWLMNEFDRLLRFVRSA